MLSSLFQGVTRRVLWALVLVFGHPYTRHSTLSSVSILFLGSVQRADPEADKEQVLDDEDSTGPVLQVGSRVWATRLTLPSGLIAQEGGR